MLSRIIQWSGRNPFLVLLACLFVIVGGVVAVMKTPLDALPDISDPQVIVYTEWMGRSPDLVEDQITYPLVRTLQSTPGVVTFAVCSDTLMRGTHRDSPGRRIADSLYTPPSAG